MDEQKRNRIVIGVVLGAIGCGCLVWLGVITAAILLPIFSQARAKAQQVQCISNQKAVALAMRQYIADFHDTFPPASQWTELVKPYLGADTILICPAARYLSCGYAFYQPLSGRKIKTVSQPSSTPMLFDSSQGQFNYADEGQSLALRHFDGAVFAFVDGHVRWLSKNESRQVFKGQIKP